MCPARDAVPAGACNAAAGSITRPLSNSNTAIRVRATITTTSLHLPNRRRKSLFARSPGSGPESGLDPCRHSEDLKQQQRAGGFWCIRGHRAGQAVWCHASCPYASARSHNRLIDLLRHDLNPAIEAQRRLMARRATARHITVDRDRPRDTRQRACKGFAKEGLCCCDATVGSEQEVDRLALLDRQQHERPNDSSLDKLVKNPDGSTDIYVGPTAPKGLESNWIRSRSALRRTRRRSPAPDMDIARGSTRERYCLRYREKGSNAPALAAVLQRTIPSLEHDSSLTR